MTEQNRWRVRPENSNWGDFGADDQLGRLNLLTPERRRAAALEVREGLAFCLSLPLDCPKHVSLNPRRFPPQMSFSMRGEDPVMNFPMSRVNPGQSDVICDDHAKLSLQFSTQWDSLCHIGAVFDPLEDGQPLVTYYNGYQGSVHVNGPYDYLEGRQALNKPLGAHALGIERLAETGLQGRGVMVDLFAHVGLTRLPIGYDALMRILDTDHVEVEPGDILCLRTGFDRALLQRYHDADAPFDPHQCSGLDGADNALQDWIERCGVAALVSDNEAVEVLGNMAVGAHGPRIPLHHLCLFKLGIPLGEMFLLSDLADWLRAHQRSRFLFTAPPLRLPGAVGSPVTGVGTV